MMKEQKEVVAMRLASLTTQPEALRKMFSGSWGVITQQVAHNLGISEDHAAELVGRAMPWDMVDNWVAEVLEKHAKVLAEMLNEDALLEAVKFFESNVGKAYLATGDRMTKHTMAIAEATLKTVYRNIDDMHQSTEG